MSLGSNPAYPHPGEAIYADYYQNYGYAGMTIRQRYAMAAMQGYAGQGWTVASIIAHQAFEVADAMIAFEEKEYEEKAKREASEAAKAEIMQEYIDAMLRNKET